MSTSIVDFLSEDGTVSGELIAHLEGVIEKIPHQPSRIQELGLFTSVPLLNTTTVKFDKTEFGLELIQTSTRGTDAPKQAKRTSNTVHFETSRIAKEVDFLADEILNLRRLGETSPEAVDNYLMNKSKPTLGSLRATREWNMLGALKGIVVDADGFVLENLYDKMGTAAPDVIYFDFDNLSAPGAIRTICSNIVRATANKMGGVGFDHVHAFVGPEFMDKMANHPETRETYISQEGAALRSGTAFTTFTYGEIVFEEYRGTIGATKFVKDAEARFFPVGAVDAYQAFFAPADRIGYEGLGAVEYALPFVDPKGRSRSIEYQSNMISVMKRPDVLFEGNAGAKPQA